jgi:hypothetical protein
MNAAHLKAEAQNIIKIEASDIEIIEEEGHEGKDLICAPRVCYIGPISTSFVFGCPIPHHIRLWFLSRGFFQLREDEI